MHENYFPNCEVFMTLELKKPIFSVEYKTEVANLNNLLYLRSTCTPEINLDQRFKVTSPKTISYQHMNIGRFKEYLKKI